MVYEIKYMICPPWWLTIRTLNKVDLQLFQENIMNYIVSWSPFGSFLIQHNRNTGHNLQQKDNQTISNTTK